MTINATRYEKVLYIYWKWLWIYHF